MYDESRRRNRMNELKSLIKENAAQRQAGDTSRDGARVALKRITRAKQLVYEELGGHAFLSKNARTYTREQAAALDKHRRCLESALTDLNKAQRKAEMVVGDFYEHDNHKQSPKRKGFRREEFTRSDFAMYARGRRVARRQWMSSRKIMRQNDSTTVNEALQHRQSLRFSDTTSNESIASSDWECKFTSAQTRSEHMRGNECSSPRNDENIPPPNSMSRHKPRLRDGACSVDEGTERMSDIELNTDSDQASYHSVSDVSRPVSNTSSKSQAYFENGESSRPRGWCDQGTERSIGTHMVTDVNESNTPQIASSKPTIDFPNGATATSYAHVSDQGPCQGGGLHSEGVVPATGTGMHDDADPVNMLSRTMASIPSMRDDADPVNTLAHTTASIPGMHDDADPVNALSHTTASIPSAITPHQPMDYVGDPKIAEIDEIAFRRLKNAQTHIRSATCGTLTAEVGNVNRTPSLSLQRASCSEIFANMIDEIPDNSTSGRLGVNAAPEIELSHENRTSSFALDRESYSESSEHMNREITDNNATQNDISENQQSLGNWTLDLSLDRASRVVDLAATTSHHIAYKATSASDNATQSTVGENRQSLENPPPPSISRDRARCDENSENMHRGILDNATSTSAITLQSITSDCPQSIDASVRSEGRATEAYVHAMDNDAGDSFAMHSRDAFSEGMVASQSTTLGDADIPKILDLHSVLGEGSLCTRLQSAASPDITRDLSTENELNISYEERNNAANALDLELWLGSDFEGEFSTLPTSNDFCEFEN